MKTVFAAILPVLLSAHMMHAADYTAAMQSYLDASVRAWAEDPALVAAIVAANAERADYDQRRIAAMDLAWRAELAQADGPTIAPVIDNDAADFLRAQVEASGGKVTEAFITDNRGLNVAVSSATTDMWQGDEDKFTKVYPAGATGMFLGDVELDESTQSYQGQVSIAITDPSGVVIGTLTVGINADSLI